MSRAVNTWPSLTSDAFGGIAPTTVVYGLLADAERAEGDGDDGTADHGSDKGDSKLGRLHGLGILLDRSFGHAGRSARPAISSSGGR